MAQPRTDGEETRRLLLDQVSRGARSPFHGVLADALANAPTPEAWQALAQEKPHLYATALRQLGQLAGYRDESAHLSVTLDASKLAVELMRRHGPERARAMLEAAGLPAQALLPNESGTVSEGEG